MKLEQLVSEIQPWIQEKQKPNLIEAALTGRIHSFLSERWIYVISRRGVITIGFVLRFILLSYFFTWFSWGDIFYELSLVALLNGAVFSALEPLRVDPTPKSRASARLGVILGGLSIFIFVIRPSLLRAILREQGWNVFDEARVMIGLAGISEMIRTHTIAIHYSRGIKPMPLKLLALTEFISALFVVVMIQTSLPSPLQLSSVILTQILFQETTLWFWLAQRVRGEFGILGLIRFKKIIINFSWRDLPRLMTDLIGGVCLTSEQFILIAWIHSLSDGDFNTRLYLILTPMVHLVTQAPRAFLRQLRPSQSDLTDFIKIHAFWMLIGWSCATSLILSTLYWSWTGSHTYALIPWIMPVQMTLFFYWMRRYQIFQNLRFRILQFQLTSLDVRTRPGIQGRTLFKTLNQKFSFFLEQKSAREYLVWIKPRDLVEFKKALTHSSTGLVDFGKAPKNDRKISSNPDSPAIAYPLGSRFFKSYLSETETLRFSEKLIRCIQKGTGHSFSWKQDRFVFQAPNRLLRICQAVSSAHTESECDNYQISLQSISTPADPISKKI
jgi:hypothetical protein